MMTIDDILSVNIEKDVEWINNNIPDIKTEIKWFDNLIEQMGFQEAFSLTEQAWMEDCVSTDDLIQIYSLIKETAENRQIIGE